MGGVLQAIHKLGNIGTLSLDEQVARVNTVFGKSSITKQVNFQTLATNSNLSYGVLMLLFRVSQEVFKETLGCLYFDASGGSFPNLEAAKEQKQREPMKLDVPEKEIIEITMDQSETSTSTPLHENAMTPKKKKSRKSKKQKKQPEDTASAEKGKKSSSLDSIRRSRGVDPRANNCGISYLGKYHKDLDEKTKEIPDHMGQDTPQR
ncbi:hypothetical protein RclHR1_06940004 [Rhizophagus clarus]|nr:hypothetical protein RclHR1_06940004 [Rhizophagus clarus]